MAEIEIGVMNGQCLVRIRPTAYGRATVKGFAGPACFLATEWRVGTLVMMEAVVRQTAGCAWPGASTGQIVRVTVESQSPGPNGAFRYLVRPALRGRPNLGLPDVVDWTASSTGSNSSPRKSPPGSNVGITRKPESEIQWTFTVSDATVRLTKIYSSLRT